MSPSTTDREMRPSTRPPSNPIGGRPILPAPNSLVEEQNSKAKKGSGPSRRDKNLLRRNNITAVACQPCQQRKSKCDGDRPICTSCSTKNRTDCIYDAAGDQRRTAALKQKIREQEKESEHLKEIISAVASSLQRDLAVSMAQQLEQDGFNSLEPLASLLRNDQLSMNQSTDGLFMEGLERMNPGASTETLPHIQPIQIDACLSSELPAYRLGLSTWATKPTEAPYITCPAVESWSIGRNGEDIGQVSWAASSGIVLDPSSPQEYQSSNLLSSVVALVPRPSSASVSSSSGKGVEPLGRREEAWQGVVEGRYWYRPRYLPEKIRCFEDPIGSKVAWPLRDTHGTLVKVHAIQPLSCANDTHLGQRYTDFVEDMRRTLSEGLLAEDILGPPGIDPGELLGVRNAGNTSSAYPSIGDLAASIIDTFVGVAFPEKLGMMVMMTRYLRWSILPSQENYGNMPECMRPTPSQIILPHPAWIDYIPWPEVRDVFIRYSETSDASEAFQVLMANISVNWECPTNEIVHSEEDMGRLSLNFAFEKYVEDLNNWSLYTAVLVPFPMLANKAWIRNKTSVDTERPNITVGHVQPDFGF